MSKASELEGKITKLTSKLAVLEHKLTDAHKRDEVTFGVDWMRSEETDLLNDRFTRTEADLIDTRRALRILAHRHSLKA